MSQHQFAGALHSSIARRVWIFSLVIAVAFALNFAHDAIAQVPDLNNAVPKLGINVKASMTPLDHATIFHQIFTQAP